MGLLDYFIRKGLIRSSIYIAASTIILFLFHLDIANTQGSFYGFLQSDSIKVAMSHVFDSMLNLKEHKILISVWLIGLMIINFHALMTMIVFRKEINMPYALGLFNPIKKFDWQEEKVKNAHDRFVAFDKDGLFYKNPIAIDVDKYMEAKNKIIQYLGLSDDVEIDIVPYQTKGVVIRFYVLPKQFILNKSMYEKGYMTFGMSAQGVYRTALNQQTHLLCVGESGSGKSNFMHQLLHSIWINTDQIEHVDLIDLKGTELYRYKDKSNVRFIDTIEEVYEVLGQLKDEMNQRFTEMKEHNDQIYSGKYRFVFIDEIGTIGTHPNKKIREEIFANMIELFQKGRAAKILFFIFAQKIDSTNIPSNVLANIQTKVLMKTDSDFNINNTIGTKESLEKITRIDPDAFPRGRAIVKDGITSQKVLIQVPYIDFNTSGEVA